MGPSPKKTCRTIVIALLVAVFSVSGAFAHADPPVPKGPSFCLYVLLWPFTALADAISKSYREHTTVRMTVGGCEAVFRTEGLVAWNTGDGTGLRTGNLAREAMLNVGGKRLRFSPGWTTFHESGRVKTGNLADGGETRTALGPVSVKAGPTAFYENGTLRECVLQRDTAFTVRERRVLFEPTEKDGLGFHDPESSGCASDKSPGYCFYGTIEFYESGVVRAGYPAAGQTLPVDGGELRFPRGAAASFREDGRLSGVYLKSGVTIQAPCAGTLVSFMRYVVFHDNGRVKSGVAAAPSTLRFGKEVVAVATGDIVRLHENGALKSAGSGSVRDYVVRGQVLRLGSVSFHDNGSVHAGELGGYHEVVVGISPARRLPIGITGNIEFYRSGSVKRAAIRERSTLHINGRRETIDAPAEAVFFESGEVMSISVEGIRGTRTFHLGGKPVGDIPNGTLVIFRDYRNGVIDGMSRVNCHSILGLRGGRAGKRVTIPREIPDFWVRYADADRRRIDGLLLDRDAVILVGAEKRACRAFTWLPLDAELLR